MKKLMSIQKTWILLNVRFYIANKKNKTLWLGKTLYKWLADPLKFDNFIETIQQTELKNKKKIGALILRPADFDVKIVIVSWS